MSLVEVRSSRSLRALQSFTSFLGLVDDADTQQWRAANEKRAKQGLIGLVLRPKTAPVQSSSEFLEDRWDESSHQDVVATRLKGSLSQIILTCDAERQSIEHFGVLDAAQDLWRQTYTEPQDESATEDDKSNESMESTPTSSSFTNEGYVGYNTSRRDLDADEDDVFEDSFGNLRRSASVPRRNLSVSFSKQMVQYHELGENIGPPGSSNIVEPPSPDVRPSKSLLKAKGQKRDVLKKMSRNDFVFRAEAFQQYHTYVQLEKEKRLSDLKQQRDEIHQRLEERRDRINEVLELAREHYFAEHGVEESKWSHFKDLLRGKKLGKSEISQIFIRRQLESLTEYRPWFTYIICLIQILSMCIVLGLGHVTSIGLEPKLMLKSDVSTYLGTETKEHWKIHNIWIGPSQKNIIGLGAVYAPCMRLDQNLQLLYALTYNSTEDKPLGCCEQSPWNVAGTAYQDECARETHGTGVWSEGLCSSRSASLILVPQRIRPCCQGLLGQCLMTTFEHCVFMEGVYFHEGPEHCTQVNCLSRLCGFGGPKSDPEKPYLPLSPAQGYRLPISLFYHQGVIHLLLVVGLQFLLARPIERVSGWLRMMCLYCIPAYLGLLTGSIMNPYSPHVGGDGGVFGLLAVSVIELIQSWRLIPKPWPEVAKLGIATVLFLLAGTLPYVDMFTLLMGFGSGLLCGVMFLPYITFSRNHAVARRVLIGVSFPLLFFLVFLVFYMFYNVQLVSDGCHWCDYINCVPYTDTMCKTLELW